MASSDRLDYVQTFQRANNLIDMLENSGNCDPALTSEIREIVMKTAYNMRYYDMKLGVRNLSYFMMKADEICQHIENSKYGAAFFNIKKFSLINRKYGFETGNEIISRYIKGLEKLLSDDECVCTVGGDSGVILFRTTNIRAVRNYFAGADVQVKDNSSETVHLKAVVGMNQNLTRFRDRESIMDSIVPTMNQAKRTRGTDILFFDERIKAKMEQDRQTEHNFKEGLENDEFDVYYQPKVYLRSYEMIGAEALCRWKRMGRPINPDSFIPVLEQTGSICDMDFFVLEKVCRDIRSWIDNGNNPVQVSVNFSCRHFEYENLLARILEIINKYKVPHGYIQIELQESEKVDFDTYADFVTELRDNGISASLDNFGTEYSSINLVRKVPWSVLKLDKSLLRENEESGETNLFKTILNLCREIGMECIACGVESSTDIMFLKNIGCYCAQGYYFDKPLSNEEFLKRLQKFQ